MVEIALSHHFVFPARAEAAEPRTARDGRIMQRAVVGSLCLHAAVVIALIVSNWITPELPEAAPMTIDVSLVELSALDTALPPQAAPPSPPQQAQAITQAPAPQQVSEPTPPKRERKIVQSKTPEKVKVDAQPKEVSPQQTGSVAPTGGTSTGSSVGGGNDAVEKARISYQDMVATLLARAKRYPDRAVRNRITGSGVLRVKIASEGSVVSVEVVNSTSSPILDEELRRMVDRAAPFPAFPPGMGDSQVALLVPVSFRLDG